MQGLLTGRKLHLDLVHLNGFNRYLDRSARALLPEQRMMTPPVSPPIPSPAHNWEPGYYGLH